MRIPKPPYPPKPPKPRGPAPRAGKAPARPKTSSGLASSNPRGGLSLNDLAAPIRAVGAGKKVVDRAIRSAMSSPKGATSMAAGKPKRKTPTTGGQRRGAPRPEEYPRDKPNYPKTPGRVYPKGTAYKPRTPEPGRPKPGVVPPKRKPPVTTTTTVPKTPGVAQALPKKKKK